MRKFGVGIATALVGAGVATMSVVGVGEAQAAPVPTVAVTQSGNTDWAITFDRGNSRATTCDVYVGGRKRAPATEQLTYTLEGDTVAPGRHPVRVRCGTRTSPTIWVQAPRNQVNDLVTWFSNVTAGALGV